MAPDEQLAPESWHQKFKFDTPLLYADNHSELSTYSSRIIDLWIAKQMRMGTSVFME